MAQYLTPHAGPPGWRDEQALIEWLEELREQAAAVKDSVRRINPAPYIEAFAERAGHMLDAVAHLLALHLPQPSNGVVGDLEGLERATDGLRVPRIDPELGEPTDALKALRSATGLLLRAIQDARRAAETARGADAIPAQTVAVDAPKVRAMLRRLDNVETELKKVAREKDTAPSFVQQNGLVSLYVDKMRVKLDLARLHLTIDDVTFDLGALTGAIEAMGDITRRFQAGVDAWSGRVSRLLTASTETIAAAVLRVVFGVRTLGKIALRTAAAEVAPEMILIPSGTFMMGIPEAESKREGTEGWDRNARPRHRVDIRYSFMLGKYPVTRGEYGTFARDTRRGWPAPDFPQTDRHPAVMVSFEDARAYAEWLSRRTGHRYRLPSEAEWEYACRAGTVTARYWGERPDPKMSNFGRKGTTSVGTYLANPWGLFDMIGNVSEWVEDRWHGDYNGAPDDGSSRNTSGQLGQIVRGGSWYIDLRITRAGNRVRDNGAPSPRVGFRLARTL